MGCYHSALPALAEVHLPKSRRRLSIGTTEWGGHTAGAYSAQVSEEGRGLIAALADKDITQMLAKAGPGRGSRCSMEDEGRTAFAEKGLKELGEHLAPEKISLGHTCRKGLKPESPNQDSWFILKVANKFAMYGVFDGHGKDGHGVSNFVKDTLPKLMIKDRRAHSRELLPMMKDAFLQTQALTYSAHCMEMFNAQASGTTASVVIHDHSENKLTVAHVADSTVVLGRYKNMDQKSKDDMEAVVLTRDHKPNIPDEKARVESAGGTVLFDGSANHRIYVTGDQGPGLSMSRCIGDLTAHQRCGVSAEPEVSEFPIKEEDHVLLVCSDGVWEFITPIEAVEIVSSFSPANAMKAAATLAKEAWDRWIEEEGGDVVDDITALVVYLNQPLLE